jgi:polyphosphate kinase
MPETQSAAAAHAPDLTDPSLYINRELSWLEFNHRVLEEAMDPHARLLERLKFLAIGSSNLDEFFMVRVAGLKRQVKSQAIQRGPDGLTAEEQLRAISAQCHAMVQEQSRCLKEELLPGLSRHGIVLKRTQDLSGEQSRWVKDYFHRLVFPVLTPLALDPAHPFPHLRNRSLNLVVTLRKHKTGGSRESLPQDGEARPLYFAVVQVPGVIPRLVQIPGPGFQFVLLEDVICSHISELFQGLYVTGCYPFRITRDSDLNFDEEEVEDLLETIEQEVRRREWGEEVRLEVAGSCGPRALAAVLGALQITQEDIYSVDGPLNLVDFMALYRLPDYAHLKDEPFLPPVARSLHGKKDLFAAIREKDLLLHHPFESFNTVLEFVEQAADDPDVLAIKQTLYRTSGDSPVIAALARAAQNGKQVTALVELKARFDEANNISWARELERAGVHVVYGLVGLKTHCKVLLVIRREPGEERLRRYVHLGTGNYHPATARLYTDLGLLTCNLRFGQDVSRLFNVLTGYSEFPHWRKLAVAPLGLRERVLELVEREAQLARKGQGARIIVQMNSLVDPEVIAALYRASQAGVKIDLIVRGVCCLRAQVPGVSENIRVISIVSRFLEHCRIFYFRNGGSEEVFLSSGDWMPRNLSRRVETMFPVEDPDLKRRVIGEILATRLKDNVKARELRADGRYVRAKAKRGAALVDSQAVFLARSLQENAPDAERLFSPDLLLHDPEGTGGKPGGSHGNIRPLTLTELYPMRSAPPDLPPDAVHPPDPAPPVAERAGKNGDVPHNEELRDASGL